MTEPAIAFRVREHDEPAVEVRVNFGVFAGRDVTAAEIDDLARLLAPELDRFSVVAEERHEFGGAVEAQLHQVRIEISQEAAEAAEVDPQRIVDVAERWAEACIADRRADVGAAEIA